MTKIAIIGAGLAELTAARGLSKNSNIHTDIQIFEKSWRAGGRMSSWQTRTEIS
jgi:uncharacterized protein with NAD-binding domain and iron-sulfur cluster